MNSEKAKQLDIVDYLSSLGYKPARRSGNDYWYLSPLREERTSSFKVNRNKNVWYDHGLGKGGNLVDFGILYHNCTVSELLIKLGSKFSFHQQPAVQVSPVAEKEALIKIIKEYPLVSLSLVRYLKQRRIAEDIAAKYCREVIFSLNDKQHTAIGFRNNQGGYELRNQWFKGSASPKAISTVENGSLELSVFEGFFDFLSYQSINKNQRLNHTDFLILNSTSFFEKNRPIMDTHNAVHLFLDRDNTGKKLAQVAINWDKKYKDESHLYEGYNDLNEWAQQIGKKQSNTLKQKP